VTILYAAKSKRLPFHLDYQHSSPFGAVLTFLEPQSNAINQTGVPSGH
jgi:hypothetical protein